MNKDEMLGMPFGTAQHRLRKIVLLDILKRIGENVCFRCAATIDVERDLSLEHKVPWRTPEQFWDVGNVAFSHLSCNSRASKESPRKLATTCNMGHPFSITDRGGHRRCRTCNRDDVARHRDKQRSIAQWRAADF